MLLICSLVLGVWALVGFMAIALIAGVADIVLSYVLPLPSNAMATGWR